MKRPPSDTADPVVPTADEPEWLRGASGSTLDEALAFQRFASVGPVAPCVPVGRLSVPSAVPHVSVHVSPAVDICLVAPPLTPALACSRTGAACSCRAWWAATHCSTAGAYGAALSEAASTGTGPPAARILLLLWPPGGVAGACGFAVADVLAGACGWAETVVCANARPAGLPDAVRWTARSPEIVCAALWRHGQGRRGVLVGTGCPAAVLCDADWWDGPGLDARVPPCMHLTAPPSPLQRCHVWSGLAAAPVRPPPGSGTVCPAFVARAALFLDSCGSGPGGGPPARTARTPFPCLCGAPEGAAAAVAYVDRVDHDILRALDTAASGVVGELLVAVVSDTDGGLDRLTWLGPFRTSMLLLRLTAPVPVAAAVAWLDAPCQTCSRQGGRDGAWLFLDELEAALDAAPFAPGQHAATRLPPNRLIVPWLRFSAVAATLHPHRVALGEPGQGAVDVWRVLLESRDGTEPPARMVLVDARTLRPSSPTWRRIKERVVLADEDAGVLTGTLWHGGEVQDDVREHSTLRIAF